MASSSYGEPSYYRRAKAVPPGAPAASAPSSRPQPQTLPPMSVKAPSEAYSRASSTDGDPYPMGYRESNAVGPPAPLPRTPGGAGTPDAMARGIAAGNYFSMGSSSPSAPVAPTRVVPRETGRTLQAITAAGDLPIDQNQANLKRYADSARYLEGMSAGPPLGGQRTPYGARQVSPIINPVLADFQNPNDPGVPAATAAAPPSAAPAASSRPVPQPVAATSQPPVTQTLSDLTVRRGATSQSGRSLGYGELARDPASGEDVRVFSDGSGGIPSTMSLAQITDLERGDRLSTYDSSGGFAIGPNGSFVGSPSRSRITPSAGLEASGANSPGSPTAPSQLTTPAATTTRVPVAPVRPTQADFARSDLNSIATEDPRSAAGIAARNLRLNQEYAGNRSEREAAAAARGAQVSAITGEQERDARLQESGMREQGATERANIGANAEVQSAYLNRTRNLSQGVNEDGTLAQYDETGVARPVVSTTGERIRPVKQQQDPTTKRRDQVMDALNKSAGELLAGATLGGTATDAQIAQARLHAARLHGLRLAQNKEGQYAVEIDGEWTNL